MRHPQHRAATICTLAVVLSGLSLPRAAQSEETSWLERFELNDERLAKAEVMWTSKWGLSDPNCAPPGCLLDVIPFSTSTGAPPCIGEACPRELCPATTPFYAQPTPSHHCSGILVGEDLILTAGHCVADLPAGCTNQRFIFDYAVQSESDPLGEPVPPEGGQVFIQSEDVFACAEIVKWESPFPPGTTIEEAFSAPSGSGAQDFALMRMTAPVGPDRIPIPIERLLETMVGDDAVILGHPAVIPLKAEIQPVSSYQPNSLGAPFGALVGNSGSGIVSRTTGKAIAIATNGTIQLNPSSDPSCQVGDLWDLCFTCLNTVGGQGAPGLSSVIPPVGLQVAPAVPEVHHYGPPTTPGDFPGHLITVSAPPTQPGHVVRPIDWYTYQEGEAFQMLDVVSGPISGTLQPGEQANLLIGPTPGVLLSGGEYGATMPLFDDAYETRTPITHHLHVGVDGFVVVPSTPMAGEGPGVLEPPGASKVHRGNNRWIVDQDVTVSTDVTWIKLNGIQGPTSLSLTFPEGGQRAVTIEVDAPASPLLDPDVYTTQVHWTSQDSGTAPPFELLTEVRMDLCRQIYSASPATLVLEPGESETVTIDVTAAPGHTLEDTDVAVFFDGSGGGGLTLRTVIVHPGGSEVELSGGGLSLAEIFDDDTSPPSDPGQLESLENLTAAGTWLLRVENTGQAGQDPITVDLTRLEVRLHTWEALPCT